MSVRIDLEVSGKNDAGCWSPGAGKLESFISADDDALAQFCKKFLFGKSLKFVDGDIERQFRNQLRLTSNSFKKHIVYSILFLGLCIFVICKDIGTPSKYKPSLFPTAIAIRAVIIILDILFLLMACIPYSRPFVRNCHQVYLFLLTSLSGLSISSYLFMYAPETGLPWTTQALTIVALTFSVREKWVWQLSGGLAQVLFFVICAECADHRHDSIVDGAIVLLCFALLSQAIIYTVESNIRMLYKEQQISLFIANRHSEIQRRLAERATCAEKVKSQFIANMSHEIRTPLHGVITSLDLLKSSGELTPEQQDYVLVAENSSNLLLDILNNILTIAKLEAGKVALEREPVNLRSIVENVATVCAQLAAKKDVEVWIYVPPLTSLNVLSDSVHLKQILFNLASNAVKFTERGHVGIVVRVVNDTKESVQLAVDVLDTGIGIATESLHLLFQRFSQVDGSSTRKFQGTGLGLALVSEFSHLFGGTMSVQSDGLGHGSTFTFTSTFQKDLTHDTPVAPPAPPATLTPLAESLVQNEGEKIGKAHNRHHFSDWPIFIHHSHSVIGEHLKKYFSLFEGLFSPVDSFDLFLEQLFSSEAPIRGKETPCCLVVDSSLCRQNLEFFDFLKFPDSDGRKFFAKRQHRPLFVLFLENPGQPKNSKINKLDNAKIWTIKKPCNFGKINEIVGEMKTYLVLWESAQHRQKLEDSRSKKIRRIQGRRFSVPLSTSSIDHFQIFENENESMHKEGSEEHESETKSQNFFRQLSEFKFGERASQEEEEEENLEIGSAKDGSNRASPRDSQRQKERKFSESHNEQQQTSKILLSGEETKNEDGSTTPQRQPPPEEICKDEPHKKVLVVDDNTINRKLTERLLTKAGYVCTSVEDGSIAVDAAKASHFSLIFMDITMPVMDGCTATRLIQEHQRTNNVSPKTLICALSAADVDRFSPGTAFDEVLPKPIQPNKLLETAKLLTNKFHSEWQALH